jgi:hypothetical protein
MGRQKRPQKRPKHSPVAAFFIGGSSLIFATFVFVAPAMPRLNLATLDFPPLHGNLVVEEETLSSHPGDLITTKNQHGNEVEDVRVPERILGTKREPSAVQGDAVGQRVVDAKREGGQVVFKQERVSSSMNTATQHKRMDAPFGSRIEHARELQANIIDPRSVQVISLDNPRAFLYKRFMSDAECDFMVVGGRSGFDLCRVFSPASAFHASCLCEFRDQYKCLGTQLV